MNQASADGRHRPTNPRPRPHIPPSCASEVPRGSARTPNAQLGKREKGADGRTGGTGQEHPHPTPFPPSCAPEAPTGPAPTPNAQLGKRGADGRTGGTGQEHPHQT
ncbi:MAG: hypothetical protein LBL01_06520, partial [Bifidobacteriaceae bacterium]|nr:hypothetical protein [Bifidobacteriaceae bacterium]